MRLFHNKRGVNDKLYFMLFELILVILVFTILFVFVHNSVSSNYFEKRYHSRNMALIMEAMYGAPGDYYFEYVAVKDQGISFDFSQGSIKVFETGEDPSDGVEYRFLYDNTLYFFGGSDEFTPAVVSEGEGGEYTPGSPQFFKSDTSMEVLLGLSEPGRSSLTGVAAFYSGNIVADGFLNLPTKQDFGISCGWGCYAGHKGNDYRTPVGSVVVAAYDGTITTGTSNSWGNAPPDTNLAKPNYWGNVIYIDHGIVNGKNYKTIYAHLLPTFQVNLGDKVVAGQPIALSGNTGTSTGPHLHFEVRANGVAFDPYNPHSWVWTTNPPSHTTLQQKDVLCGDGTCDEAHETKYTCAKDCCDKNYCIDNPTDNCCCGNEHCDATIGEDTFSCPEDCLGGSTP